MNGIPIKIYIVKDGSVEPYAFRRWAIVPRVGDTIELRREDKWELANVTHVRWGSESENDPNEQRVALFAEWR